LGLKETIIPLLIATHQWHLSLENHHKLACVFFDFAKAVESACASPDTSQQATSTELPTSSVSMAIQLSVRPLPASGAKWNLFILATCYLWGSPGIYPGATLVLASM